MRKLDIRWISLILNWVVAFTAVLAIMSVGRSGSTIDGSVPEFTNNFGDLLNFTLFSGRTLWTFLFALGMLAVVFVLDKYGDMDLSGKRRAKSGFMLGILVFGAFTAFAFAKMYEAGFSWITVTAFIAPTIIAILTSARKRAVS